MTRHDSSKRVSRKPDSGFFRCLPTSPDARPIFRAHQIRIDFERRIPQSCGHDLEFAMASAG